MNNEVCVQSVKRGYLNNDFQFFHLKDKKNLQFQFHHHDFNKIIVFLSGKVTYLIEGKAYRLKPWDVLFIGNDQVHKPFIDSSETYERMVIWMRTEFLDRASNDQCDLSTCFKLASTHKFNLLRLELESAENMRNMLVQLEEACDSTEFGSALLKNSLITQVMVHFNRLYLGVESFNDTNDVTYDETIVEVIDHINLNISDELSVEKLSSEFHVSKYHLMRKFKAHTGYTLHSYITQKRLIMARELMRKGRTMTEASMESGFGDYSSFVRAFKNMFGMSPRKYKENMMESRGK